MVLDSISARKLNRHESEDYDGSNLWENKFNRFHTQDGGWALTGIDRD